MACMEMAQSNGGGGGNKERTEGDYERMTLGESGARDDRGYISARDGDARQ